MASRVQIRVEGLEASRAKLEQIMRGQRAAVPQALAVIGEQWVTEVRRRAPLLTGRLRRSYTYDVGPGYVELSSNLDYAAAQEFGTRYQDGTPHVRPGTEAVIRKVPQLVAAGMARASGGGGSGGGGGVARVTRIVQRLGALGG